MLAMLWPRVIRVAHGMSSTGRPSTPTPVGRDDRHDVHHACNGILDGCRAFRHRVLRWLQHDHVPPGAFHVYIDLVAWRDTLVPARRRRRGQRPGRRTGHHSLSR